MRHEDHHAKALQGFINAMAMNIDCVEPESQKQKTLLEAVETEKDFTTSHIMLRGYENKDRIYLWASWHPYADTSYIFASSHRTVKDNPYSSGRYHAVTITNKQMQDANWYQIATGLVSGYSPALDKAIDPKNKLVAAVVFWLKGIANEILVTSQK